jgi:hypothetical protein
MAKRQPARTHEVAETPIIDGVGRIVGWTRDIPAVSSGRIVHAQAEAALRGPVTCTYVQITDRAAATRAGAPPGWPEPWRCLAFVPDRVPETRSA